MDTWSNNRSGYRIYYLRLVIQSVVTRLKGESMTTNEIEEQKQKLDQLLEKYTEKNGLHKDDFLYQSLFADTVRVRKDLLYREILEIFNSNH